jgi:tyrosine-protein kinase Etk/Wzc
LIYLINNDFSTGLKNVNFNIEAIFEDSIPVRIYKAPNSHPLNGVYKLLFHSKDALISQFSGSLSISSYEKSTIINITTNGNVAQKNIDLLNAICSTYEENQIEQKNEITEKTIQFIENQLKELSTTLSDAETELENFKKRSHSSIDIKDEAKEYYNRLNDVDYESELLKLELKNLDHVIRQLEQSTDFSIIAPSFADIKDPLFLQLLNELRTLDLQRKQLAFNTKENFPTLSQLNKNIENTRKALINNILNLKKNLNAKLAGLNDLSHENGD